MNAPARPIPPDLPPAAQAAIALVGSFEPIATTRGPFTVSTARLLDGRYETALFCDSEVLAELTAATEPEARRHHDAMVRTLEAGMGPRAPQAAVQARPPASTVVWSVWCRDGEQEDIVDPVYRLEGSARHACAALQQRHPRLAYRVIPLGITEEE